MMRAYTCVLIMGVVLCGSCGADDSTDTAAWAGVAVASTGQLPVEHSAVVVTLGGELFGLLIDSGGIAQGGMVGTLSVDKGVASGSATGVNYHALPSPFAITGTLRDDGLRLAWGTDQSFTSNRLLTRSTSLAEAAGNYHGEHISGTPSSSSPNAVLGADGEFVTGAPGIGCEIRMTLSPRGSHGLFDAKVRTSATNCGDVGAAASGVAIIDANPAETRLYVMTAGTDRTSGFLWTATRCPGQCP